MKNSRKLFLNASLVLTLSLVGLFLLNSHVAQAAFEPIVQCGINPNSPQEGCQVTDIFSTAYRVIRYMFTAVAVFGVVGVVYGGVLMVTSAGNSSQVQKGQKAIKYSMIGLAIVLLSVLIVDSVFKLLKYDGPVDPLNPSSFQKQ